MAIGPRFLALLQQYQGLSGTVPWAANTAYTKGQVVTNGGSSYVATAAVPSRATFTASDWVQIAAGAQLPFVGTLVGDGTKTVFTFTHNLNKSDPVGQVHDPADNNAVVPGADITFPTVNTATVVLVSALASGVTLTLVLE